MGKFLKFLKTPMGITLIVVIALIIVSMLTYNWYQKKYVWNGIGKKAVVEKLAKKLVDDKFNSIKTADPNYLSSPTGTLNWYKNEINKTGFTVNENFIKQELILLGIDVNKYPQTLNIGTDISKEAVLQFNKLA